MVSDMDLKEGQRIFSRKSMQKNWMIRVTLEALILVVRFQQNSGYLTPSFLENSTFLKSHANSKRYSHNIQKSKIEDSFILEGNTRR